MQAGEVATRARLAVLAPELANGVRAALVTIVPFFLAGELHRPELAWVALGGWLGALADPGGARTPRIRAVMSFLVCSTIALTLVSLSATTTVAAAVVLAAVVFTGSFAASLGATAQSVGTIVSITATIAAAHRPPLLYVPMFAAGVALAMITSAIAWPIWRHRPVRVAVARVFDRLAEYADAIAIAAPDDWPDLARRHQRAVRTALEQARATTLAVRARHAGETPAGANLRALVGAAEDVFFRLIAAAEQVERGAPAPRDLGAAYRSIARDLYLRSAGERVTLEGDSAIVRETLAIAAIAGDLDHGGQPVAASGAPVHAPWRRRLRDALSTRGPILHHALRISLLAAVALTVGHTYTPAHPTWVPVTAVAVLQPYLGPTLVRAAERVLGTILGATMTFALITVVHDPLVLTMILFPLAVLAVVLRSRSYRLFVLFLTPVFVLITDLSHADWHTGAARVIDVALGGALALVAALIIPSRERLRLGPALDGVLDALARYVRLCTAGHPRESVVVARREVGLALEAAEVSLERMLAEPARLREGEERAMYIVTYARRLSASLTELLEGGDVVPTEIAGYLEIAIERARTSGQAPPEPTGIDSPALQQLVQRGGLLARVAQPTEDNDR
ncbi:MAG TPA: FUSC family protein [Kofleriaceae bacterium]|jgi:uncharacterized membrane protein YccC